MNVFEAIIYGFVQGVAEFLPISSSGHLALAQNFFGTKSADEFFSFNILLHFATLIAVFIMYYKDIVCLFNGFFSICARPFRKGGAKGTLSSNEKLFLMICIATLVLIPAALLSDKVKALADVSWAIGVLLLVNGVMLFVSDKLNKASESLEGSSLLRALYIGLFQLAGILPGISRSGATITGGLFNGLKREDAVRFSFLMSIPAILGANILELADIGSGFFDEVGVLPCLAGMCAAIISGIFAIKLLQFFAKRNSFTPFAVYSLVVGTAAIVGDIFIK